MDRIVLLLTACINPQGMSFTNLQNSAERKKQYVEALHYYLQNTTYKIVFCNNSGEILSEFFPHCFSKRLEMLSFSGNDYDVSLGKGYGELSIIKYAFEHSCFLNEATIVIKVTGRLKILNLQEVVRLQRLAYGRRKEFVYVDFLSDNRCDSRCFIADKTFFLNGLVHVENKLNDSIGYWFENYLYDLTIGLSNGYIVSDYVLPLCISGQSGSTGELYECRRTNSYNKLRYVRDYCQRNRCRYKKDEKFIYFRMSLLCFVSRICKFLIR